jgi:hypothetical protein
MMAEHHESLASLRERANRFYAHFNAIFDCVEEGTDPP